MDIEISCRNKPGNMIINLYQSHTGESRGGTADLGAQRQQSEISGTAKVSILKLRMICGHYKYQNPK